MEEILRRLKEQLTCILSSEMNSTEQWLLATKSRLTPKVPAHRKSPVTVQSPIQSLQQEQSADQGYSTGIYQGATEKKKT